MRRHRRAGCFVLGVLALLVAADARAATVAVFDHAGFVDTTSGGLSAESDNVQASLAASGHTVRPITATSAADLVIALADADLLLIPELENADLSTALESAALAVMARFVAFGGALVINGTTNQNATHLLNALFGITVVTGVVGDSDLTASAAGTAFADGPSTIPRNTRTRGIDQETLPPRAVSVYVSGSRATVARLSHLGGRVVYLGWDWFAASPIGSVDGGWLAVLDEAIDDVTVCADPKAPDADGDGIADPCDFIGSCADVDGQRVIGESGRLVLKHINADQLAGNDQLQLSGRFLLPAAATFASVQPLSAEVQVIVSGGDGSPRVALSLPPQRRAGKGTTGWQQNRRQNKWTFTGSGGAAGNGSVTMVIKDLGKRKKNLVNVTFVAKKGDYAVVALLGDEPLEATVVAGDPAAGICATTTFSSSDCRFGRDGTKLTCD
jgi:hypothetical protein